MSAAKRPLAAIEYNFNFRPVKNPGSSARPQPQAVVHGMPQDEDNSVPFPSVPKLLARLQGLYPGVSMDSDDDYRVDHVRKIFAIAQEARGIREWKTSYDDFDLPTHAQILAYKLLTLDGNHPESTVAALKGSYAEYLLYPKAPIYDETCERLQRKREATESVIGEMKHFIDLLQGPNMTRVRDMIRDWEKA